MATSGSDSSSGKTFRSYGGFSSNSAAASLFDAAFSKPVPKRSQKVDITSTDPAGLPNFSDNSMKPRSPLQVFSPPVSLPESTSSNDNANEDNLEESDDDDETPQPDTQNSNSSQSSLTRNMSHATIENSSQKRDATDEYDFDEIDESPPIAKKSRIEDDEKKLSLVKRKPVYRHKWNADDDDEEEESNDRDRRGSSTAISRSTTQTYVPSQRGQPIYARDCGKGRVRNVKEPHQILESGEHDDYKDDLNYMLTSLKGDGAMNIKCLSATSLARKCINPQFRHFIRSQKEISSLLHSLADAPSDERLALSASAVIYLLSRDSISISVDTPSARLLANLLKMDKPSMKNDDVVKHYDTVWEIFASYLEKMESTGRKISFDCTREELSPSSLILEALVFILTTSKDPDIKNDLLNLGILQWIVAKVDRLVNDLENNKDDDDGAERMLIPLERCFRVLECCTIYHKKNQAFLIAHRSSAIIIASHKLLSLVHSRVSRASSSLSLRKSLLRSLTLMARVLTNLSYDNELCSTKLGQLPGFLSLCLSTFTYLSPKYVPADRQFDLTLLMSSLVVNLVERCNGNRKKIVDTKIKVYSKGVDEEEEEPALVVLTKMFLVHEEAAREADTGIDKELVIEEPDECQSDDGDDDGGDESDRDVKEDGRLDRGKMGEMNEGDMIHALKGVLNKASSHMEDSVIASHIALLIGCVLQQNEDWVRTVRSLLPDERLSLMVEQLQRYLDFLRLAGATASQSRSMEKIIEFLERIDA